MIQKWKTFKKKDVAASAPGPGLRRAYRTARSYRIKIILLRRVFRETPRAEMGPRSGRFFALAFALGPGRNPAVKIGMRVRARLRGGERRARRGTPGNTLAHLRPRVDGKERAWPGRGAWGRPRPTPKGQAESGKRGPGAARRCPVRVSGLGCRNNRPPRGGSGLCVRMRSETPQLRSWSPTRPHITPARRRRRRRHPAGGENFWGFLRHFHWRFACTLGALGHVTRQVVGAAGMAVWRGGPTPGDTSLTLAAFGTASKTIKLGLDAKEMVEIIDVTIGFDIHRLR